MMPSREDGVNRVPRTPILSRVLLLCFDREQLLAVRFVARGASAGSASTCVRACVGFVFL